MGAGEAGAEALSVVEPGLCEGIIHVWLILFLREAIGGDMWWSYPPMSEERDKRRGGEGWGGARHISVYAI